MNGTMQYRHQVPSRNCPDSTEKHILDSFLKDESFVSKTLNEGHVELSKIPASTVHQLGKKMESSQATVKHMKQVARDPQAVQVNLM